ncbi:MAG: hypothetical protein NTY09_06195 [bacterium]|nr:hypothetical protein [bacterium]
MRREEGWEGTMDGTGGQDRAEGRTQAGNGQNQGGELNTVQSSDGLRMRIPNHRKTPGPVRGFVIPDCWEDWLW